MIRQSETVVMPNTAEYRRRQTEAEDRTAQAAWLQTLPAHGSAVTAGRIGRARQDVERALEATREPNARYAAATRLRAESEALLARAPDVHDAEAVLARLIAREQLSLLEPILARCAEEIEWVAQTLKERQQGLARLADRYDRRLAEFRSWGQPLTPDEVQELCALAGVDPP